MTLAAALLGAPLLLAAAVANGPRPAEAPPSQRIVIDVRGPVALIEVTRTLPGDPRRFALDDDHSGDPPSDDKTRERIFDLALPDGAALVDVALAEHGRWRSAEVTASDRATHAYADRLEKHGLTAAREPLDEGTTLRVRVACERGAPVELRLRFSLLPELAAGRRSLRLPASPERVPTPADVTVRGAGDVEIAGARATRAHVSTRSAWAISWAPRAGSGAGRLAGTLATARLSATETLAAVSVEARGVKPLEPPPNVLFVVDRSRSVGLAGLAAERDLAGRLLEALPPSTRFDALFFDRQVRRLFPLPRPATREALSAFEAEMVPDRMQNGTDLPSALRDAGALLRREASAFGPRALLVLVTDGALPEGPDGAALARALGATPGVPLGLAVFVVRPTGDDPAPAAATRALGRLAAAHGGLLRELVESELREAVPAALATLARGGDVADVRLVTRGGERALIAHLAPGESRSAVLGLGTLGPTVALAGTAGGGAVRAALHAQTVDAPWLRALSAKVPDGQARLLATDALVALVETPVHAAPVGDVVKGSLDRTVVRNTLALAYMPRARACYLNRTAGTPAERDLTGRVRLAIDLTRGEVGNVAVQSSTLNHPDIEGCLREGAFAIDVPRTLRSDSPSTAILNLVFRPRTPEKAESAEEAALGAQIDLVIEELHREEPPPQDEVPPIDRSMIPTR